MLLIVPAPAAVATTTGSVGTAFILKVDVCAVDVGNAAIGQWLLLHHVDNAGAWSSILILFHCFTHFEGKSSCSLTLLHHQFAAIHHVDALGGLLHESALQVVITLNG